LGWHSVAVVQYTCTHKQYTEYRDGTYITIIADLLFKIQHVLPPDDTRVLKHVDILIKKNSVEGRTCVCCDLSLHFYEKFDNLQYH
jgi:hypothetical protein